MSSCSNSYDLLVFLKEKNLLAKDLSAWWNVNTKFEMFLGSILTQNTKWTNVEKSLANLKKSNLLSLHSLSEVDIYVFISAIAPSGFKNQKSRRIKQICKNILEDFKNFDDFCENVSRDWLLSQKGIGCETADTILCYVCQKDYMVVDSYTNRLLKKFSYEFNSYEEIQDWIVYGINENYDKIVKLYGYEISLNELYARFHGKIVEYMKKNKD